MDRRDKEIQYLHRKLQEYEERVEDLQDAGTPVALSTCRHLASGDRSARF